MGLLTQLVLAPLAPVRGVVWLAERLESEAYEQLFGVEGIRRQLHELGVALDEGRITEQEYVEAEEVLLDRLDEAMAAGEAEGTA